MVVMRPWHEYMTAYRGEQIGEQFRAEIKTRQAALNTRETAKKKKGEIASTPLLQENTKKSESLGFGWKLP